MGEHVHRWGVLVCVVVAASSWADGYRRATTALGECLWWGPRDITFVVDGRGTVSLSGKDILAIEQRALDHWRRAIEPCSDLTLSAFLSTVRSTNYDGVTSQNVILFRYDDCEALAANDDPCWGEGNCANAHDCWDGSASLIVRRTESYSVVTGQIFDVDVEFNNAHFGFVAERPDCNDVGLGCAIGLEGALTMLTGYALGLDDVSDANSTMSLSAGVNAPVHFAVDPGSAAGVCTAYPKGIQSRRCGEVSVSHPEYGALCGSILCNGCCTADQRCVTGTKHDACGLFGDRCEVCSASEVCDLNRCAPPRPCSCGMSGAASPAILLLLRVRRRRRVNRSSLAPTESVAEAPGVASPASRSMAGSASRD